jgi:hypothetical protein
MNAIRTCSGILTILAALPLAVGAKDSGGVAAIQTKLESEYKVTKITADASDIVTAGSVVVLHKDHLLMIAATTTANPCMNTYRDGKLSPSKACNLGNTLVKVPVFGKRIPHADQAPATRTFVAGEKFWVTKIGVKDSNKEHAVVLGFFSDAINDVRFKGELTIPFPAFTTADDALQMVADVITVVPAEDAKDTGDAKPAPASQPVEAAPKPIEAPPPPPPDPTEVKTERVRP